MLYDPDYDKAILRKDYFEPQECEYLEFVHRDNGDVLEEQGTLDPTNVAAWIKAEGQYERNSDATKSAMRLLIGYKTRKIPISRGIQTLPLSRTNLELAMHEFVLPQMLLSSWARGEEVAVAFTADLEQHRRISWLYTIHGVTMTLTYNIDSGRTLGLMFLQSGLVEETKSLFERLRESKKYFRHPMLVPTVFSQIHSNNLQAFEETSKDELWNLQLMVGMSVNAHSTSMDFLRQKESALKTAVGLSERMRRAAWDQDQMDDILLQTTLEGLRIVDEASLTAPIGHDGAQLRRRGHDLKTTMTYLLGAKRSRRRAVEDTLADVALQISCLDTLFSQHDNELAVEMGKKQTEIANAAKRDSSSMKVIAVLTTVFLPGTFIATIYSMPMIQVDSTPFWEYWAVTVPVTLVVMVLLIVWMMFMKKRYEEIDRRDEEAAGKLLGKEISVRSDEVAKTKKS